MERHTRFQSKLIGGAALLALVSFSLIAAAKLSKAGDATAGFHATGPGGLGIDAKTTEVDVADDGTNVKIIVKLGNLDAGGDLRSKHTKEDLEVTTFPTAELTVPRASLKMGGGDGDAKGTFKIHGQTKEMTFHYSAKKNGDTLEVSGTTKIIVGDFGVKPRSYLGVSIKPEVDISASFKAKDG
jgi:polyisoprenoid-binding protein YceI